MPGVRIIVYILQSPNLNWIFPQNLQVQVRDKTLKFNATSLALQSLQM